MNDDNTGRHKRPDLVLDDAPLELSTDEREALLSDTQRRRHAARFPPGTPVLQTSEDRDLAARRRRRRTTSHVHGVPVQRPSRDDDEPATEPTNPLALVPSEPEECDLDAVRQAGRDPYAPFLNVDAGMLGKIVKRQLREEMRREREESDERNAKLLHEVLDRPSKDATSRLERDMAFIKKVAGIIALFLLGVTGAVAKGLYDRGGHEMAVEMRIEQLRRDVDRVESTLERLERRDAIPPFPTQKGQLP